MCVCGNLELKQQSPSDFRVIKTAKEKKKTLTPQNRKSNLKCKQPGQFFFFLKATTYFFINGGPLNLQMQCLNEKQKNQTDNPGSNPDRQTGKPRQIT